MQKADRLRAFGPWLLIAVLACLGVYCGDVFFDLRDPEANAMMTYIFCGTVTPVFAFSAVLACLPFASGFIKDVKSGLAVSMQLRCGRKRFLTSKILCTVLSGGLALMLGMLAFIVLLNLTLSQDYTYMDEIITEVSWYDVSNGFSAASLVHYYGVQLILQFLAGAFYASIGLAVSAFLPNTSLMLCAVFVIYRLMKELAFFVPEWLVPVYLQIGSVTVLNGMQTLLAGVCVLGGGTLLCCAIFYIRAGKRLRCS